MTIAISEILKQVELLSSEERQELATKLVGSAQQSATALSPNGHQAEADAPPLISAEESAGEDAEEENWLDNLVLNRVPPKRTYTIKVKFVDGGRGLPRRYDFGDLFDEEEGES